MATADPKDMAHISRSQQIRNDLQKEEDALEDNYKRFKMHRTFDLIGNILILLFVGLLVRSDLPI